MSEIIASERECGDCTACCEGVLCFEDVTTDNIKYYADRSTPCTFLGNNCTIYETRGNVCREFKCIWKSDLGLPFSLKPNLCGFMITHAPNGIIHLIQNRFGDINTQSLVWVLWWANKTNRDIRIETRNTGELEFINNYD